MVVIGEDGALALHEAVQRLRDADAEPLHAARERPLVASLDHEVDVIALH